MTRRDEGARTAVPPPRSGGTRRDGVVPGEALMRLPAALADRFELVAELPVQGAESDLLLVVDPGDAGGRELVVKLFRRGYSADREVWAKLPALTSPHVLRILETGHADGRDYEVAEYAPGGNLRALMDAPMEPDAVAEVVRQLAGGLAALHRAGIVHRDLKPENVLVTGTAPLALAIADFGLSRVLEQSVVFASSSRTLAYAAPESLSGQVSPARDWWSLGVIARELATGRAPFLGLSETAVVDHLATRALSADDVADPRLRLLCRGLLTRDPRRRWTDAQVGEWLDGGSPQVAETPARASQAPPGSGVPFGGRRYDDRGELARALVADWDAAARYFFGRGEAGEAWRALRDWLAGLPDDGSIELIDRHLAAGIGPDAKLLHLVRWLDPDLPPHFLGRRVTLEDLPGLAALAADPSHADHRTACLLGRALWEEDLLDVLGLGAVDARWRGRAAEWNDLVRWLRGQLPQGAAARLPDAGSGGRGRVAGAGPADDPPVVLLTLLALAAAPDRAGIEQAAERARASVREDVPWFGWLVQNAAGDPLRLLAVARTAPEAVLEVEARHRDRQAAEHRDAELRGRWTDRERQRLEGRGAAVVRAVAWTLPALLVWLAGSWLVATLFGGSGEEGRGTSSVGLSGNTSTGVPFAALAVIGVLAWAAECAAEVLLARAQGKDYLLYGPWSGLSKMLFGVSKASRAVSGAAQQSGRRGCGVMLLAGVVPLLVILLVVSALTAVASMLWALLMVVAAAAHCAGAGVRLHRWRQAHRTAEQAAMSGGTL
ncbi:serine/threonine-protein kinase [Actinomadura parmotrematis]|uniref:serine/threonine-protein kinase n=1 Tax=Actinomadura parmotrematis TaxID=2864039 RepID=UPI0027E2251C|nr:serine/threonine-protein kinase [Actinomadura parmotrematis]